MPKSARMVGVTSTLLAGVRTTAPRLKSAPHRMNVLRTLLGNAWKYTSHTELPNIRFFTEQRDGLTWFCVSDNGAGFDMSQAGRLFMPFTRLHRQDEFPGYGLGLATVQRIVRRHGGQIEAEGKVNEGATVRFTLAAAPE